jgi:EAL domain-containing protein (putative c-di-GMP-specific phosphodiesterase class I)
MNNDKRKILFSGLGEKTETLMKHHLEGTHFECEFCGFNDTETIIENFNPELIVTAITSFAKDYANDLSQLKIISRLNGMDLAVLVSRDEEIHYSFLINNGITKIITSPVQKQDLINLLNRYMPAENMETDHVETQPGNADDSCTEGEKTLISNLVIQNRMVKDTLKKMTPAEDFEKIHLPKIMEFREVENKLWDALENNYYRLFYQPVISLETEKLSGFEALIRLIHPQEGVFTPDVFIPIAEKSAIIFPLGLWIIEEACRQSAAWREKFDLDTPLRININLSAKQFIHPQLSSHIFEITEKHGITENEIAFELTESAFMEDMEAANMALLELRSRKFKIYMDDFGTGYSSLSYLMHFPVNVIKIDQSFVKWMHIDEQSEILVKSIVALAINLGLKVVAEGTEDETQIEILKTCGCHYAQGYFYSRPLPPDEAETFISKFFPKKN